MSLGRCLPGLVADGKITQEQADLAGEIFGRRQRFHARNMSKEAADALATAEAADAVEALAARKARLNLLKAQKQAGLLGKTMTAQGINPKAVPKVILEVEQLRRALEARGHAMSEGILFNHRRTLTGKMRNEAQMENIVRELHGVDTGDTSARELADAWRKTADYFRTRFNAAGGNIGKLEDWGLPHSHDSAKVRQAGWPAWRDTVMPMLDRERMIDDATGKPFDDQSLENMLHDVYDTITTEGWVDRAAGGVGQAMAANRRAEHRVLHFKSPDEWLAYNKQFGNGTPFDAMMRHIHGMTRDIAAMETLGPNPAATVKWLKDATMKDAQLNGDNLGKAENRANIAAHKIDRMWNEYSGANSKPVDRRLAMGGEIYRAIKSMSVLLSAPISAISDVGTSQATRAFNGIPTVRLLGDYLKMLNPASAEDRRIAVRNGLGGQGWANIVAGRHRDLLGDMTHEKTRRASDFFMRLSGLEAFTNAGKWADGVGWLNYITEGRGRTWDQLDKPIRDAFSRYGIDEAGWNEIRSTPLEKDGGVDWIKPLNVKDHAVGDKLLALMHSEGDFSVPVQDLATRALMREWAGKAGTVKGEYMRSGPLLFKSFGVAILLSHLKRLMERPTLPGAAGYMLRLSVPLTIAGIISLQLRELTKGRDPKPMNDWRLIPMGMAQGGGFGMFSDLANLVAEPRAESIGEFVGGPLTGDIMRLSREGFRGARPLWDDSDAAAKASARAPWNIAKVAKGYVPGQSLWYGRLAFDRLLADQAQDIIDPYAEENRREAMRKADQLGQDFWWAPGETAPARAPDFGNLTERPPQ